MTQAVSGSNTNNYWNDPINRQAQKAVNGINTGFLYDGYSSLPTMTAAEICSIATFRVLVGMKCLFRLPEAPPPLTTWTGWVRLLPRPMPLVRF